MPTIGAAHETAHREILANVLAHRRVGLLSQPFLYAFEGLQTDKGLVFALAQRNVPISMFDISREQNLCEQLLHALDQDCAVTTCGKLRLGFEEALHFGL